MKHMRKLVTLVIVLAMVMAFMVPAVYAAGTGTITITPPSNIDSEATNTYKIYKVFEADGNGTNISYKLVDGKTTAPAGFTVDAQGNVTYSGTSTDGKLTDADIAAIAAYVTEDDLVVTVTSTGSENAVASDLPNGYYYITTTTGTAVAITSTNPNANVTDKNVVPTITKVITSASSVDADGKNALAQAGTKVAYKVTIEVKKGAKGYIFHDTMEDKLTYNNDIAISVDGTAVGTVNYSTTTASDDTLTVSFDDTWIATQVGETIVITYSATVNSAGLSADAATNIAYLSYGTGYATEKVSTSVYNAKFTVTKQDGNNAALAGAGFVLKNNAGKYYNLNGNVVSWVDSIDDATEYTSDANGAVNPFTGLANGTYTLVEKTVPGGYNKAADSTVTINAGDYSAENLEKAATVVNNAGTVLPSTGGMGTTIFYILGSLMVVGAAVVLVTNKRMRGQM